MKGIKIKNIALGLILWFGWPVLTSWAGVGATPPYVQSDYLLRGSVFKQKVNFVRSDPGSDLEAKVSIDVPEADQWLSVDKGLVFDLPAGENMVPVEFIVAVPANAAYKTYSGAIRVETRAKGVNGVSVSLGAKLDVNLTVSDKKIFSFKVRSVFVPQLNEPHSFLWMDFPAKAKMVMEVENTGNVNGGPTKTTMDIYDLGGNTLRESAKNFYGLPHVPSFQTASVTAELPVHLKAGTYRTLYKIWNGDAAVREGDLMLVISPYGVVPNDTGFGIFALSVWDQSLLWIILLGVIYFGFNTGRKFQNKKRYDLPPPPPAMFPEGENEVSKAEQDFEEIEVDSSPTAGNIPEQVRKRRRV